MKISLICVCNPETVKKKHWHGASADSWLVHLAVEADVSAGPAEWLEPVTDEEYNKLK
ncbi:hypothetical protein [Desulfosporosinus sp. FKA]|uniref:hypothetical protein n=1 Tax=Desulfosporosinus sp. FKA TaxID=1969834 RepID=UPI0032B758A7